MIQAAGSMQNHIQTREKHPAKLFYIEEKSPESIGVFGGIRIPIHMIDGDQVETIGAIEPSTIFRDLLVQAPRKDQFVESPPYYPSYIQLTPEQRWVYLDWLKDITQPIDIGYVFIYYYGLERNLLLGNFETAYSEILLLRQIHDNRSFESYSYNALLFAAALKKKPELIVTLLQNESRNGIANEDLIFKYRFNLGITPDEMMSLTRKIKGTNLRYIKSNPDLYRAELEKILTGVFDQPEYLHFKKFDISEVPSIQSVTFANASFPANLRAPKIPNFLKFEPFIKDCKNIFSLAHKYIKENISAGLQGE